MKMFLSVFTALLITSVTPVFNAMAATPRRNGTTTTTARSKSNTPTTAFTDAEKKLKDLENALKAKLAEIKKAEEDKEAKTPDNTIDTSQTIDKKEDCEKITELRSGTECYKDAQTGKWKIRWTFKVGDDCPVKDCSVDKAVTKCVYEKVTESSFSCKITECIDTHEVIGGVCKKKESDSANEENNQPDEHAKCWENVDFATAGNWTGTYCDISECEDGYKVDRSRTACEEDEQPDEHAECWKEVDYATAGTWSGTYCKITQCQNGYHVSENDLSKCEENCWEKQDRNAKYGRVLNNTCTITECKRGYYIYNNKCEEEIRTSGCHYDFDEQKYGVGYKWIQESEKDTESDGKQYCKITKCHPCTTLKENKCVLTNKCMLVEDTVVACWDLGGQPEKANYEKRYWCYCSDGYKRDYFQFTTQRCVNNELIDM